VKEAAVGAVLDDLKTLPETPESKVPEAKNAADDDTGAEIKKADAENCVRLRVSRSSSTVKRFTMRRFRRRGVE